LLDDLRETAQAASILSLVGAGCHRLSEIAGRLQKPVTSLSRPIQRLVDLELIAREVPWGESPRDSKRALYRIRDPFLLFWFRFVEPNRSRLEARQTDAVTREVLQRLPGHAAEVWEELARQSAASARIFGRRWRPASRWWGTGTDRTPMEIDVVAESDDGKAILLGEASWSGERATALAQKLRKKAVRFPLAGKRNVVLALWLRKPGQAEKGIVVLGPGDVARLLR
jgi:AAA+ ATPase superfamily predicted ATPase